MLEAGKHRVELSGIFVTEVGENNTPAVVFELETKDGNFIDYYGWLSDKKFMKNEGNKPVETTMAKETIKLLKDSGCLTSNIEDLSDPNLSIEELFSGEASLTATIEIEEYTTDGGEIKNIPKVKFLNARKPKKKLDKKMVKTKYAGKYNGMMKDLMGSSLKPKSKPAPEGMEVNEDDLPF